jgi:DNA-binding FadR family transcriptional regulator
MTQAQATAAFYSADADWWIALVQHCGNERTARDLRYCSLSRGEPGSALRAAYDARTAAHEAWMEAANLGRVVAA